MYVAPGTAKSVFPPAHQEALTPAAATEVESYQPSRSPNPSGLPIASSYFSYVRLNVLSPADKSIFGFKK